MAELEPLHQTEIPFATQYFFASNSPHIHTCHAIAWDDAIQLLVFPLTEWASDGHMDLIRSVITPLKKIIHRRVWLVSNNK